MFFVAWSLLACLEPFQGHYEKVLFNEYPYIIDL